MYEIEQSREDANIRKSGKHKMSPKSFQWESSLCCGRAVGQSVAKGDKHDEAYCHFFFSHRFYKSAQ